MYHSWYHSWSVQSPLLIQVVKILFSISWPVWCSHCKHAKYCNDKGITFESQILSIISAGCHYQRKECTLKIHFDEGFTLSSTNDNNEDVTLWHYSFSQLRKSSDDGIRLLWLTFSDDETRVGDFIICQLNSKSGNGPFAIYGKNILVDA